MCLRLSRLMIEVDGTPTELYEWTNEGVNEVSTDYAISTDTTHIKRESNSETTLTMTLTPRFTSHTRPTQTKPETKIKSVSNSTKKIESNWPAELLKRSHQLQKKNSARGGIRQDQTRLDKSRPDQIRNGQRCSGGDGDEDNIENENKDTDNIGQIKIG